MMRYCVGVMLLFLFSLQVMAFVTRAAVAPQGHALTAVVARQQSDQATPDTSAPSPSNSNSTTWTPARKVTAYTLPPDLYRKARDLGRFRFRFNLIDFFYGVFLLWVILRWRFGPTFRDWVEGAWRNRLVHASIFATLL